MIKAAFFDLDGTLVSFRTHTVPESAIKAIAFLQSKGILCFAASGRSYKGLDVVKEIDFDGYITLNGQYVYDKEGVLYQNTIEKNDILALKKYLHEHPFPCGFEMISEKIYNFRNEAVDALHAITHNDDHPVGDISKIEEKPVYQLMAFVDEVEEKKLLTQMPHCHSARWHPSFCDISPKGGTKVKGMHVFAKKYGFTMEETLAFGDGGNDVEMLCNAGVSVAMKDAVKELKDIATFVTDSVEENGIAKFVDMYITQNKCLKMRG